MEHPVINIDRLSARIEQLSRFTLPDRPWTRRAFSSEFLAARAWLREEFIGAGLNAHEDAACNLIGRREGTEAGSKPLIIGSHCDTVADGGRFDGILGVLAGLEAAQALHEQGISLRHSLELIDFLSEEPSDYGISCVGSRAFSGRLDAGMLAATNLAGETLAAAIRRCGGNPDALARPLRQPNSTAAYLELHIEQGPVLETRGLPIGVVTDIVGIRRTQFIVEGRPDHAGTTPMDLRRDALVGAARVIDACYRQAKALNTPEVYVVATIGRMTVTPNAANAVPGRVELMMEVRSNEASILDRFPDQLIASVEEDLANLNVSLISRPVSHGQPTACDKLVVEAIETVSNCLGFASLRLISGAGHDAVYIEPTGPIGMLFVPCREGRSHCPEEWSEPEQFVKGIQVLYETLLALDKSTAV